MADVRAIPKLLGSLLRRGGAWLRDRPGLLGGLVLGCLALAALLAGLALGSWNSVCNNCPSIAQIYSWEPKQATKILDHNGELIAELFQQRRTPVSIATLPPYVPHAFVAIEDKRFYHHHGYSLRGIFRAAIVRVPGMGVLLNRRAGGGSTITQQLARHMFEHEIGFKHQLRRKLKELHVALEIERVYTKDQILEAYINQVNFGHGWYGIETAAQHYFGKSAIHLDPGEAALLAAVINRPGTYDPFRHPERALERRNLDLRLMAEQGYLSHADAQQWMQTPLPEAPHDEQEGEIAPYFVEWVRDQLDDRFGSDLYSKGLRVYTTLDLAMQRDARAAMDSGWARIEHMPGYHAPRFDTVMAHGGSQKPNETSYIQGMFLATDPATGEIRALIGGRDFGDSKFNRATQALRQPGSVFKPFVYTAALASGIPASHVIYDSPVMLEQPDSTVYSPKNYEPEFRGPLTLRNALKLSINTVAVKLGLEVGLETVAQTARQLGITTPVPPYPSTSIGAPSVIPLQVVEAYSTFANTGVRVTPRPILRVEDAEGRVLWSTRPDREQVVDSMTAAIMRDLLRTALDNGTGYNARNPALGNLPYEVPAAGKTGTTNDNTDVWFVGFTPDLLAAVWFGFDRPKRILSNAAGGVLAAPVWGQFMRSVYYGDPPLLPIPEAWPWPEGIVSRRIDPETGDLATQWCASDSTYVEYFIPGTEPTQACGPSRPGLFGAPLRGLQPDSLRRDTLVARDTTGRDRRRIRF